MSSLFSHLCATKSRRLGRALIVGAGLCALALFLAAGAGCDNSPRLPLTDLVGMDQWNQQVIQSKGPVVVDFYKTSCPTCVIQEDELEKLHAEYAGRIRFVKLNLLSRFFAVQYPEVKKAYNLQVVPTTILFVDGQMRQKWEWNRAAWEFRKSLDAVAPPPPVTQAILPTQPNVLQPSYTSP